MEVWIDKYGCAGERCHVLLSQSGPAEMQPSTAAPPAALTARPLNFSYFAGGEQLIIIPVSCGPSDSNRKIRFAPLVHTAL